MRRNCDHQRAGGRRHHLYLMHQLTEAGQTMTSLSLARLEDDLGDWLKWHHGAPEFTIYDAPLDEDDDQDAYHYVPGDEDDDEDPDPAPVGGFGWHVEYDFASRRP
jgi:hypothetical protein